MLESQIEREFGEYVRSRGGLFLKQNPNWYKNIPDRAVFVPGGRAFLLEFKRPGCLPRAGQVKWAAMAIRRGHSALWADTLQEAIEIYDSF